MIRCEEKESYKEINLYNDKEEIGYAEVDLDNKMLSRLFLYEPYRDKGYGTEIVKQLTKKYGLTNLWVKDGNDRAIHVYEKCGYKITKPTMHLMEISNG